MTRDVRPWFCAWFTVGALASFSLLSILTVGLYLLPVTLAATALLASRRRSSAGLAGLVSGTGVPLLYVAFLNRGGPGTVCTTTAASQSCVDEYNPWVWLAAGTALLLAGILLGAIRQRGSDSR
ncbi:hypothetical protein OIB37_32540 [Streptomyces sp. NBC_00820]|uniref:hypothetical protein n=1 Tax=Streptomyces sp. NBC_00820 TaxID=2975842 RepID=UPI002ED03F3F|nr:hypothetical protein OIB37_32540 [Streptomyces sp. NBC_00820]